MTKDELKGIVEEVIEESKSCILPSDSLRMDVVEEFMSDLLDDPEHNEEDPEYDALLDPHDGYYRQTYIQNLGDNVVFWEGFSDYCWEGVYAKKEYQNLSKEEAIQKMIKDRFPAIGKKFNMTLVDSDYFQHQSWTEGVDDGYIMKIVYKLNS
jgi:hypothetical protein